MSSSQRASGRSDAVGKRHTLEFVGRHQNRRFLVLVDGCELWLPRAGLVALCQLAASRRVNSGSVILYRSLVSRLRERIDQVTHSPDLGEEMIVPAGRCAKGKERYFLTVSIAGISFHQCFQEILGSGFLDSATQQILLTDMEAQIKQP